MVSFTSMTPQKLFDIFKDYSKLTNYEGIKYKAKDRNTIFITIPNRGKFEFEWTNEKTWRFEQFD